MKEKFGEMLRLRREEMGFPSQSAFADALGVDQSRVSRWESGRFSPDEDHLRLICAKLKVSPEYFAEKPKEARPDSDSIFAYVRSLEDDIAKLRPGTETKQKLFDLIVSMTDEQAASWLKQMTIGRTGRSLIDKSDEAKDGRRRD